MTERPGTQPRGQPLDVYHFLVQHVQANGFQPSQQDMADHFGLTKRGIRRRLDLLAEQGLIRPWRGTQERAISLNFVKFTATIEFGSTDVQELQRDLQGPGLTEGEPPDSPQSDAATPLTPAKEASGMDHATESRSREGDAIVRLQATCPKCQAKQEVEWTEDFLTCIRCDWMFQVDEDGKVVNSLPIQTNCPCCGETFQTDANLGGDCPSCGVTFMIDDRGAVLSKVTKCPSCKSEFCFEAPGDRDCPGCHWRFGVDSEGKAISSFPVTCVRCDYSFTAQTIGESVSCPECALRCHIDENGEAVIDPVVVTCHGCNTRFSSSSIDLHTCPSCELEFGSRIDEFQKEDGGTC